MDRGVLEAKQLEVAFRDLENEKGGAVTALQDLLRWPVIASAIEEGVVSLSSTGGGWRAETISVARCFR